MTIKKELETLDIDLQNLASAVTDLGNTVRPVQKPITASCPVTKCSASPITSQCQVNPSHIPSPYVADYSIPVLAPGGDTDEALLEKLGPLAGLIGTWVSERSAGFNVMPIPQVTAPNGFILKNFSYYEVMTFSAISGKVANRNGEYEQDSYTLFYEQRVFFADGPQANKLVHAENGSWLHQVTGPQGQNALNTAPYIPSPPAPNPIPTQDPSKEIVKQVSVPHGNSILALGSVQYLLDEPKIPEANTLPVGVPESFNSVYGINIPTNPNINPNIVLNAALDSLKRQSIYVNSTVILEVNSSNSGAVVNTPFMQKFSNVTNFSTTYWLETLSTGHQQLQYTQDISLEFPIEGKRYLFPHITANTLTKVN